MASSSSLSLALSSYGTNTTFTPASASPPSGIPIIAASPYDTLIFNTAAEISFSIEDVLEIVHPPPIRNSIMPPILETQVKIADGCRETNIPA